VLTRLRCTVLAGVAGGGGCPAGGVRGHVARLPDELGRLLLGPQADGGCQRDRKSGRVPERVSAPVPPRLPTATAAAAAAAPALPALSCAARLRCAAALRIETLTWRGGHVRGGRVCGGRGALQQPHVLPGVHARGMLGYGAHQVALPPERSATTAQLGLPTQRLVMTDMYSSTRSGGGGGSPSMVD
jgi:hypothetical protein